MAKAIGNITFFFEGNSKNESPTRCTAIYAVTNFGIALHKGRYFIDSGWDSTLQDFVDKAYSAIKRKENIS